MKRLFKSKEIRKKNRKVMRTYPHTGTSCMCARVFSFSICVSRKVRGWAHQVFASVLPITINSLYYVELHYVETDLLEIFAECIYI